MPWVMAKRENQVCIFKEGADGQPTGDSLGCHATEAEAKQQLAALYASERKAVKFAEGSEDTVEGPGMPFGGPFNGQDLDRQHFSTRTDFAFGWFGKGARPLLYHHGLDDDAGTAVVGRVTSWETKSDLGVWTQAQLDKQSKYFAAIKELVKAGKLYFSSGAMAHLVDVDTRSGEIKRWPWVELSLTPTPANLLATVDLATAEKHYKAANLDIPESVKAELSTEHRNDLSDSDFAYIDSGGGRHLPMNDAAHARNALARFNQTKFESDEAKQKAWRKLMARCKELGVEVSDEETKAASLKAVSYEDIRAEVNVLIDKRTRALLPNTGDVQPCPYVEATYPTYAIACVYREGTRRYLRIPYALSDDGHVASIGEAEEVEQAYIPAESKAASIPIADHAILTGSYAASLVQRTKDLSERRVKEGRVISTINRQRLSECLTQMRQAVDALTALLDSTDPEKAKAGLLAVRRLRAQLEASKLHALAIN